VQISVQWLSCQNRQGIFVKNDFLFSVFLEKQSGKQEELNSHFFWPATETRMAPSTTGARTATSGLLRRTTLITLGTGT